MPSHLSFQICIQELYVLTYGQLTHMYTFIVANMDMEPYHIIQFYCGRGKMENFIKEGKSGFDFVAANSHSKVVNANRMRLHMLAYNLFN